MKKVVLLTAAVFLFVASMNAQIKKNEINLSVGVWSSNEIVGTLSDVIVSGLTGVKMENSKYLGAIHLGYKYALSNRFAIGPALSFDRGTSDVSEGKFTSNYYSLALEGIFKYVNTDMFRLYSLVGVGATLLNQNYKQHNASENKSQNNAFFNDQITPIGISYGNSFGIFTELGFGYKGIVCAGLFYRF